MHTATVSPARNAGGVSAVDGFVESLLDFIVEENSPLGLAIIAASALVEYVFPPFPGDTITLFGAVLITAYSWSFWGVFGAVMTGSLAGSMLAFYFGGWLEARRTARRMKKKPSEPAHRNRRRAALDRLVGQFRRHGAAYLVLNRFLPGLRALFFVAAGMARMRPGAVLVYSAVSAALWNLGIIALGSLLGANFETLMDWVRQYTLIVWLVLGLCATALLARAILVRSRASQRPDDKPEE